MDALRESMKGDALKRVQGSLVLEAIVAAENVEADEEDLKKEFEKMAQMWDWKQIEEYDSRRTEREHEERHRSPRKQLRNLYWIRQSNSFYGRA